MIESESSKLRKKWPWDWKNEKLTDAVLAKILKNLPSYAKDVAYWHPTEPDWHYWYNGLEVYCRVSRDYFVKVAKEAPDFLKPKLSAIAEEAFELINMLMKWARQKYSLCFAQPEDVYYTVPYSDEELSNKWDTVVHKLNLYMSFGKQEQKPAGTNQDITPSKRRRIISWLKNHPHKYGLAVGVIFLILFIVMGLFKAQWRPWCWGTSAIPFLVLIVSLLGGRSR